MGSGIWKWLGSGFLSEVVARQELRLQSPKGARATLSRGWPAGAGRWLGASVLLHVRLSTSVGVFSWCGGWLLL